MSKRNKKSKLPVLRVSDELCARCGRPFRPEELQGAPEDERELVCDDCYIKAMDELKAKDVIACS